jgi:hypothetical protein
LGFCIFNKTENTFSFEDFRNTPHHAEGLVNPKVRALKKVTDFGYPEHVDSEKSNK